MRSPPSLPVVVIVILVVVIVLVPALAQQMSHESTAEAAAAQHATGDQETQDPAVINRLVLEDFSRVRIQRELQAIPMTRFLRACVWSSGSGDLQLLLLGPSLLVRPRLSGIETSTDLHVGNRLYPPVRYRRR